MKTILCHRASIIAALMFMAVSAMTAAPAEVMASGGSEAEARHCLNCHDREGAAKKFLDGDEVRVHVDGGRYFSSVHGLLSCSTCHEGFSIDVHPRKNYRSRKQYSIRLSRQCRNCHADESIARVAIHKGLLENEKRGNAPLCQDCHGAHDTVASSHGTSFASEEHYCMGCHGHDIESRFSQSETFELKVDVEELKGSVHSRLVCSDCHFGFTEEEHPQRSFRNARQFSLALSDICKRCHFDKYARVSESIHYKMLEGGRTDAPNCTDCHGSHGVIKAAGDKLMSAQRCAGCHERTYGIYVNSVHGAALVGTGNQDVPVCIDCHTSHDISDPLSTDFHERIPAMCSKCHADTSVMDKYGLSTDVVKTYLSDFHGITLSLYKGQNKTGPGRMIAECTDCHGTHDITGNFGSDAQRVKANLLKRCQACHDDAGEDFPDAWLSHYRPSLSHAPLVFVVDAAYKVLMPLMLVGLLLQVVLHIWRYFSSR